jgi:hypothetical protein
MARADIISSPAVHGSVFYKTPARRRNRPVCGQAVARACRMLLAVSQTRALFLRKLNLVEGFFSKFARSVLRHIRVVSKQELKDRVLDALHDIKQQPVVHT